MTEAIVILTAKLNEYNRALKKSNESFKDGLITKDLNKTHNDNLIPKISQLSVAIDVLCNYFK